jgi:hypothetical protein
MTQPRILPLTAAPDLLPTLAAWFHDKWGIPYAAYEESMTEALAGQDPIPAWYAVLDGDRIIGGLGVSGGSEEQDAALAAFGADFFARLVKNAYL